MSPPATGECLLAALRAIYVETAGSKHTVNGRKAWIRSVAGTALHAAGVPAGAEVEWGGRAVPLWHGDIAGDAQALLHGEGAP